MGIEDKFLKATIHVKNLPKNDSGNITQEQRLQIYGVYKRAVVGKCSENGGERPSGWFDITAKAKWDAWSAEDELSVEEAMKKYIELVKNLCKDTDNEFE